MSRSHKHTPIHTDGGKKSHHTVFAKQHANAKVRRSEEVPDGKAYRKFSCSWDIHDYIWYCPKSSDYAKRNPNRWARYYYRK